MGTVERWYWYWMIYSFAGFLLEVAYARWSGHPKRDRKCRLLLPLCPVYGLGAGLILAGAAVLRPWPLLMAGWSVAAATAAEYVMGEFYQRVLGVRFWDYAALPLNYKGQVCAPFSLCWSVLGLVLVYGLHPWTAAVVETIPGWLFPPALILTAVDAGVSAWALRRTGDTAVLRWYCPAPAEKN